MKKVTDIELVKKGCMIKAEISVFKNDNKIVPYILYKRLDNLLNLLKNTPFSINRYY